jgi:hypothetical protein
MNDYWIVACGSRSWIDASTIRHQLITLANKGINRRLVVVHGDCPKGADRLIRETVELFGGGCMIQKVWPAHWEEHGKMAGFIRNVAMLDATVEQKAHVLAFWDGKSKGTLHTITEAAKRGRIVKIVGMGVPR